MTITRAKLGTAIAMLILAAATLTAALGLSGYGSPMNIWHALFAPEVDGSWDANSLDGKPVKPEQWRISIRNGEVSGGRDNCNDWGYAEERDKNGERMIVSTLVGCPEGDPVREAYWAIVHKPKIELLEDGALRVSGHGHEAVLTRCEWKRVRETLPGGGGSDMMRCLREKVQ